MVGADRFISYARLAGDTPYADSACPTDSPDHGSARPDRATSSHFRLSAAVRLFGTRNRLCFVGRITRSCSYLPDHHSRTRWFAQRCSIIRRHLWRRNRITRAARLDHLPGRASSRLWENANAAIDCQSLIRASRRCDAAALSAQRTYGTTDPGGVWHPVRRRECLTILS